MSICLDRFAQGLQDPQNVAPVTYCSHCWQEIYPGEEVYFCQTTGAIVHAECLADYAIDHINAVEVSFGACD